MNSDSHSMRPSHITPAGVSTETTLLPSAEREDARLLRESEQRYRTLLAAFSQVMWTTNAEGVAERDMPMWCAFTGQNTDEARNWGWLAAIHPDDRAATLRAWEQAVAAGSEYQATYRLRRHDGAYRSMTTRAVPVRNDDGTIREWVGACTDVTEQLTLEEQLQQTAENATARMSETEAIFNAITDAVFIFDARGAVRRTNRAADEIVSHTGYGSLRALAVADREATGVVRDEYDQPLTALTSPVQRLLRGESLTDADAADLLLHRDDGRAVRVSMTGAPIRSARGKVVGAVAIARDVTERRERDSRTHAALDALLNMAESLVHGPAEAACPVSAQAEQSFPGKNEVAQRLVELACPVLSCERVSISAIETDTGILRPVAQVGLTPRQARQWWETGLASQMPLSAQLTAEQFGRLAAGEPIVFDTADPKYAHLPNPYDIRTLMVAPMITGGRFIGILALDHGAEAHVYAADEYALTSAVAKLAALVLERDRLLTEREAARAQALALTDANARMDEFLGIVSHELRNPLTILKVNLQLAKRRLLSLTDRADSTLTLEQVYEQVAALQNFLRLADRHASISERLVSDLVDFSRLQSSQLDLRSECSSLTTIVADAVAAQRQTHPERAIEVAVLANGEIPVLGDADRISQVVTNYLTNALKYSPVEAPVRVCISVEGPTATVSVTDQGQGLPVEEQALIWERFSRAPSVTDLSGTGASLGLGLHICKSIIERQGGQVGVRSAQGEGSTFWFSLPVHAG